MKLSPSIPVGYYLVTSLIVMLGCDSGSGPSGAHQPSSADPASIEGSVIVQDNPVTLEDTDPESTQFPIPAGSPPKDPDSEPETVSGPDPLTPDSDTSGRAIQEQVDGSEPEVAAVDTVQSDEAQDSNPLDSGDTTAASVSIAEKAGVLANQREQTLNTGEIGSSLRDPEPLAEDPDFLSLNFNQLASFKYDIPDEFMLIEEGQPEPGNKPVIPEKIRKLSGKKVAVTGFMLPLKVENGLVTELLLMRDQSMCCFGTVPEINEWISVKTSTDGFKPINDQAVTFFGQLKVDEIRENGYLVGIYEMDGLKMVGPGDLKEW